MKRHFFFVLAFPPAFMNLLLITAHPDNLLRYFLSGYVVAALPALAISLTDEMMDRSRVPVRALWCAVVGFVFSPAVLGLGGLGVSGILHTAVCGGVTGFLCAMAYHQTLGRVRAAAPLAVVAAAAAAPPPEPVTVAADLAEAGSARPEIAAFDLVAAPPDVTAALTDVAAAELAPSEQEAPAL